MPEHQMPQTYTAIIWASPFVVLGLMIIWLRVVWKTPAKDDKVIPLNGDAKKEGKKEALDAGDAWGTQGAEPYKDFNWKKQFDITFLIGWIVGMFALAGISYWYDLSHEKMLGGKILSLGEMRNFFVKMGLMVGSSVLGGLISRQLVVVNETGYVISYPAGHPKAGKTQLKCKADGTPIASWFKVNYTRKIQHFAAYAVPILCASPFKKEVWVTVCWGDMATLFGFLLTIQPIRESTSFFMMQFNSYDRPEDRPMTIQWIVLGDILPGMIVLAGFFWLWQDMEVNGIEFTKITYIIAMVAGLGDGFAEPVGVTWGKNKYEVMALCAGPDAPTYKRSWEGSACVAWFSWIFVVQKWYLFPNATAFWLSWVVFPPLMALSEAKSPHTMDTPFIFIVGGLWLWLMLYMPALSFLEPH